MNTTEKRDSNKAVGLLKCNSSRVFSVIVREMRACVLLVVSKLTHLAFGVLMLTLNCGRSKQEICFSDLEMGHCQVSFADMGQCPYPETDQSRTRP